MQRRISDYRCQRNTNVVPIGVLNCGSYLQRALLFKVRSKSGALFHSKWSFDINWSASHSCKILYRSTVYVLIALNAVSLCWLKLVSIVVVFDPLHANRSRKEICVLVIILLFINLNIKRSPVFQFLADKIGLACTIVRGEYRISYNTVIIRVNSIIFINRELCKPIFISATR